MVGCLLPYTCIGYINTLHEKQVKQLPGAAQQNRCDCDNSIVHAELKKHLPPHILTHTQSTT